MPTWGWVLLGAIGGVVVGAAGFAACVLWAFRDMDI